MAATPRSPPSRNGVGSPIPWPRSMPRCVTTGRSSPHQGGVATWPHVPRSSSARSTDVAPGRGSSRCRRRTIASRSATSSAKRRCEQMSGGVPPGHGPSSGPRCGSRCRCTSTSSRATRWTSRRRSCCAALPALSVCRSPQPVPRQGAGRHPRPATLPDAPAWFGCFDTVQLNADEMENSWGPIRSAVAAGALARGCRYAGRHAGCAGAPTSTGDPVRTALIPAEGTLLPDGDPTDAATCLAHGVRVASSRGEASSTPCGSAPAWAHGT